MHGAYEHSRRQYAGPAAASWTKMIFEQGLAVDELVEDQPRTRGTRRVRWASIAAHRRCSMEGCCTTPSSEHSDGGGVAARRGGDIPGEAWKYSSNRSPTTGALSWVRSLGKANATHPWLSSDAVPPLSERSDRDSWSLESEASSPRLCAAGTSFGWRKKMRKARSRYEYSCRRRQDRSWASNSSTGEATTTASKVLRRGYSRGQGEDQSPSVYSRGQGEDQSPSAGV